MIEILKEILGKWWDYGTVEATASIVIWSVGKTPPPSKDRRGSKFCLDARDGYIVLSETVFNGSFSMDFERFKVHLADPNCLKIARKGIKKHIPRRTLLQNKSGKEHL